MGRAGRYTLSVMAWVAAYAGWSSLIGLVVAAITGDRPRDVSPGASALMTVVGPLVPTLVALWFNDWARDGFPTKEQRRARAEQPRDVPVVLQQPVHVTQVEAPAERPFEQPVERPAERAVERAEPRPVRTPAPGATPRGGVPVVQAHPLGVPVRTEAGPSGDRFPVAPLLRDGRDVDGGGLERR